MNLPHTRTWDVQDGKCQVMRWEGKFYHSRWDVQDGKWQVMRWEDKFYHKRWDFQDKKWQIIRWEDEFTTGNGMFKMGSDR